MAAGAGDVLVDDEQAGGLRVDPDVADGGDGVFQGNGAVGGFEDNGTGGSPGRLGSLGFREDVPSLAMT